MHKNKLSKHKPVLITQPKPRNPVVAALTKNPKRNAGRHKAKAELAPLTMLDIADKEE
jgi:hypothetical protein